MKDGFFYVCRSEYSAMKSILLRLPLLAATILCHAGHSTAQSASSAIAMNQTGFYTAGPKTAIIRSGQTEKFYITSPDLRDTLFTGTTGPVHVSALSGRKTCKADFSGVQQKGHFVLCTSGSGVSRPFVIGDSIHSTLAHAALKGFYFQRMSVSLPERYAGPWHRPAGHPDHTIYVHPSAASAGRPAGTVISSPGGWYDAGDYNKYIVNSGITTGTLLSLYEDYHPQLAFCKTNIPESGNSLPDLLDEVLWNLRWMLTMQDPLDGGVYHKCTTAEFEGFIRPEQASERRYVVQKSTAAALNFAAVTAQAARVFASFPVELPGLADSCREASVKAWAWAVANPNVIYDQGKLNAAFDPDINTGSYGDGQLNDEWLWASTELCITTSDESFLRPGVFPPALPLSVQSWSDVQTMAYFSLFRYRERLPSAIAAAVPGLQQRFLAFADSLAIAAANTAYATPMETDVRNFVWGSNAVCANQGILLLYAFRLSGDKKYRDLALSNLDYILGRNATGYSYVTGFGTRTPMHPHHRPSETDNVKEPVPGLLAGGPNPGQQDKCPGYPNNYPDESYLDDVCSYASNEIAINWNAPLVYLTFALEFLISEH